MKIMTSSEFRRRRRQRGVALVITLLMVSMLAFLVVAYFSRTVANRQVESASKGSVRAEVLARSGAEAVIADLKAEIIAGSDPVAAGTSRPVYLPTRNANGVSLTVVPSRVLATDPTGGSGGGAMVTSGTWKNVYPNLVKQSVGPFFPAGVGPNATPMIKAATNVTTDTPSVNSRFLYWARWQKSELNGPNAFTAGGSVHMPRWIMVTREGFPATAQIWSKDLKSYAMDNPKAAIGRFAFNVYDTGGLLDVNVAGYPPITPNNSVVTATDVQELKGALTGAELVGPDTSKPIIPGVTDLTLFTTGWKYLASGTKPKFMPQWRLTASNGFLRAASGDNVAMGRQDLIRLAKKKVSGGVTPQYGIDGVEDTTPSALPYFTHFTRASNAPAWRPVTPTGSSIDYAGQADAATSANRSFLGVRVKSAFTRADGTIAQPGDPLVRSRFPLSRLAGLGLTGPVTTGTTTLVNGALAPATAATIQRDFGLLWDTSIDPVDTKPRNYWTYVGHSGVIRQDKIKTLDQVATDGREPNLFELLKAGILSGSLGVSSDFESFCANMGEDANPDYQVIQIGANIIDQADTDSFPTRIAFGTEMDPPANVLTAKSAANPPVPTAEVKVFSGVEDIPYLTTILSTAYRRLPNQPLLNPNGIDTTQTPTRDYINGWFQFVVWKPQQQTATSNGPTQFRIAFSGGDNYLKYGGGGSVTFPAPSGPTYGTRDTAPTLKATAAAPVTVSFSNTIGSFRTPTLLGGMGDTASDGFASSQPNGSGGGPGLARLPRGMWLGETLRPERIYTSGSPNKLAPTTAWMELRSASDTHFEVQYQDGTGVWRTYQRIDRFGMGTATGYHGRYGYGFADAPYPLSALGNTTYPANNYPWYQDLDVANHAVSFADPRSQRFGLMAMFQESASPGDWKTYFKQGWMPSSSGIPNSAAFGPAGVRFTLSWGGATNGNPWSGHKNDSPITRPMEMWADDGASPASSYSDLDGVKRRADGDSPNGVFPMQVGSTPALGLVLNHPFRSVGELGYVFRDSPWKSLDLFSTNSADAALLDIFSVTEQPAVVAGKVNLNTRNPVVLQAIIANALREELTLTSSTPNTVPSTGGATSAQQLATKLVANTSDTSGNPNTGPMLNVSELATRLSAILPVANASGAPDQAFKTRREVMGRALAGAGQTHTWNLMVDVIAQSGRYPVTATSLPQFVVEGEKRYWLHVAIDRLTGQVVDQQLESVTE